MLANQTSSKKCFPYSCFLTKVFQYFVVNLVGIGNRIGTGKIYNKHTFKRMGFSRNEDGVLVREAQEDDDEVKKKKKTKKKGKIKGDEVRSKRNRRRQLRQCGFPKKGEFQMHKMTLKDDQQRSKRSLKITRLYEDEVINLKTLKTRRMVRDSFIRETFFEKLSLKN
ncbi:hypothetical protein M9H77_08549 [Catharanthus roseus]|uniref:Uncharacterized protein n=1 Tax=Catharanthus roseus TaxID=4058 RepID=A0ACC0BY38_CATRO|nr:hypothetical protein M9H77_08549 [Catharanthus roseus]